MKTVLPAILIATLLCIAACKKDKDPEPEVKLLLTEMRGYVQTNPGGAYLFRYNGDGNIEKFLLGDGGVFYTYDDNKRVLVDSSQIGGRQLIGKYRYSSDNQLQRIDYIIAGSSALYMYVEYIRNNGRIEQVNEIRGNGSLRTKSFISYDGAGNVIKIETQSINNPDSNSRYVTYEGHSYDDNPNYMSAIHGAPAYTLQWFGLAETLSAHNATSFTTTGYISGSVLSFRRYDYVFEYNADNYPSKYTLKGTDTSMVFTYKK